MNKKPISVLHIDDGRIWRGGQHQVFLLISELQKLGVRQALAAPAESPLAQKVQALGIEIVSLQTLFGELDPFAPRRLVRFSHKWRATLLHAHTGHAHALGLRTARKLKPALPLVVTRRVDFPVSHNFFSRRKYTAPGQHFIAISTAVRDVLIAGGVAPENITIVHSGVPPIPADQAWPREKVRTEFGIADNEMAILNIGALTDHKGQKYLIAAAPGVLTQFPNARFHIFGEGELHSELQQQISSLNLDQKVVLHGHVPDARLKLAGFDLFVSSSHLEGLGTVILDAMLASLPVVAARGGGVVDIIRDNETGWLAIPKQSSALAAKISEALSTESLSISALQLQARRMVEERFTANAMGSGTFATYQSIVNR